MNNRIIILAFFLVFLFIPLFLDINIPLQQAHNSDENKIIYAIDSVSESVVGISVISTISNQKLSSILSPLQYISFGFSIPHTFIPCLK